MACLVSVNINLQVLISFKHEIYSGTRFSGKRYTSSSAASVLSCFLYRDQSSRSIYTPEGISFATCRKFL